MDRDTIWAVIVGQIREVVPELADRPIAETESMAELGLDSIERSEIIMNTLEAIGLDLPMVQVHGPKNLGELADLLHAKRHA
ncbi:MAG: acyl carrier protein [Magnetospirillum sp.]|nr:acyl carrier protein [Magnetospirillum sp.]